MVEHTIKFGTDGWRGIIAEDFTFNNVRICSQGIANHLTRNGLNQRELIIGYDTRFASEDFAAAAAEVIAGNGIKTHLCLKPTPTPVISYAVTVAKAAGAIIITASHNPGQWNGFKYRSEEGASVSDEVISKIEKEIACVARSGEIKKVALAKALKRGMIDYLDPRPVYLDHLKQLIDVEALRHQKLNIIVDSMYGAGAGYFETILKGGNVKITEIHAERNPLFPNIQPEPIAKNLTRLSQLIVAQKADIGLATDGDADRIGIIDEKGTFLNQHQVFALLCLYLLEVCGERGAMVKTLTSTSMLPRLGQIFGVPVHETPVGFKYVAPLMIQKKALIGGEESGGYGFRGHIPERDAVLAGLYFLDFMVKTGKTPSQLLDYLYSKVGPHYYDRADFHIPKSKRQTIFNRLASLSVNTIADTKVSKIDTTDGFRFLLDDESWLLIRFSGTEPLVRIYAEAGSPEKVTKLLQEGNRLAGL